ncbi:hypothetical protein KLMA_10529 [Kluyveromyces marxianus]|uniref:Uncharacterized protein n=1 Tax=Kluyveromyces marxianus (strain DMKU3-1042 / BCC 29191 / NBRC 104275) TaxID=1003335 RepID=W0T5Q6_KLUMD|nr:hypothetical protein KLMA_10529 [Kluyveromyces marxianus DMKU3-1042]BAO38151.1 hypothetical protein KLMA_10529 [Kluyveromyces marxianus DMKU3-1042]BAP69719.1 hypothetical protein KLMA_10529 [Kluyveromyces marxianus]
MAELLPQNVPHSACPRPKNVPQNPRLNQDQHGPVRPLGTHTPPISALSLHYTTLHYGYTCMPSSPFLSFLPPSLPSKIATTLRHSPIKTQPATQLIKDRKRRSTEQAQRNAHALAHTAGVLRMLDLVRKDHKTAQNPAI